MEITLVVVGILAWPVALVAIGLILRRMINDITDELKRK